MSSKTEFIKAKEGGQTSSQKRKKGIHLYDPCNMARSGPPTGAQASSSSLNEADKGGGSTRGSRPEKKLKCQKTTLNKSEKRRRSRKRTLKGKEVSTT